MTEPITSRIRKVPSYRKHKASGQAIVTLPDGLGRRRDVLLGKHGTQASRVEYARVIAEWEANGRRLPAEAAADMTVSELLEAFLNHAEKEYPPPSSELDNYKPAMSVLRHLYGPTPAAKFGPLALKAARKLMIDGWRGRPNKKYPDGQDHQPLARSLINQRVGRIKRIFKWAVGAELLPASILEGLRAVEGLRRGRSTARESEPVKPVCEAFVDAVLPHVNRHVAGLARLMRVTGMRPGEACIMRACDLDTSGDVWLYRPSRHKTQHRDKDRVVAIGATGQAIIREFLTTDLQAYLFSPRLAMAERSIALRAKRRTRVQPSQQCRRKRNPKRAPGDRYTPRSLAQAIASGCQSADADLRAKAIERAKAVGQQPPATDDVFVPRWGPNRLRHNFATLVRKTLGLEAAQVALGHSKADVTQIYAEKNLQLAGAVARKLG